MARLRQDLGADSLAGLTYTDRTEDGAFNRVIAADARIVFKKLYYVLGQVGSSWTLDRDDKTRQAPMWQAEFDRTARRWGFNYKLVGFGESFETQSGYVPRSNMVEFHASNRFTYYGRRGAMLESASVFFGPTRVWRYGDFGRAKPIEGNENANFSGTLRGGWMLSSRLGRDFVTLDPRGYATYETWRDDRGRVPFAPLDVVTNWGGTYSVATPAFQKFSGKLDVKYGGVAIFSEGSKGRETRVTATLGLRPTGSIRAEGSLVVSRHGTRERRPL